MFGSQSKFTGHTKRKENMINNEETSQSIKTGLELTQMLELAEKIIKAVIISVFKKLGRDIKDIKKTQSEILKMKATMSQKNSNNTGWE